MLTLWESTQLLVRKSRVAFGIWVLGQFMMIGSNSLLWRFLWPTDLWLFTLIGVIVWIVAIVAGLWLGTWVLRYLPIYQQQQKTASAQWLIYFSLSVSVLSSILGALSIYIGAPFIEQVVWWWERLITALQLMSLMVPVKVLSTLFRSYFLAHKNIILYHGIPQLIEPMLLVVAIGATRYMNRNFLWFVGVYTIWMVLLTLVEYLIVHYKYTPWSTKQYTFHTASWLYFSVPLLFAWITYFLLNWADNIVIGSFIWAEAVWIYTAGFVLAHLLMLWKAAIQSLFLPLIAEFYAHKHTNHIEQLFKIVSWRIFLSMVPFAVILWLFSVEWLWFFYGEEFQAWNIVLILLLLWVMVNFTSWLTSSLLKVYKKTWTLSLIIAWAAVCNIIVNISLVGWYGIEWVAAGTLFWFIVLNILFLWFSRHYHKWLFNRPVIGFSLWVVVSIAVFMYFFTKIIPLHFIVESIIILLSYSLVFWWGSRSIPRLKKNLSGRYTL